VPQIHVALTAATPKRAFLWGWLTGTFANTIAFSWMDGLLERFGHMSPLEALPIMLLLTAYQGLEFALFSWGVRRVHARAGATLSLALVATLVMVAIELAMPQVFRLSGDLAGLEPAPHPDRRPDGPHGVSALMVAWNGALYEAVIGWRARRVRALRPLAVAAALVVADLAYGAVRIHQVDAARAAAPKVKTGIVQANVGILEKWDPAEFASLLDKHQRLSARLVSEGAGLIVWPESSYPYPLPRTFGAELSVEDPRRVRRGFEAPLLFGAVTRAEGRPAAGPTATRTTRRS
jgi:apolipoprotein N-acyltransferase